jgi:hypothetical protein
MVVIVHALCAVFHFCWVIARFAIDSPFHESVGVPGGHGAVPIRTICPIGCPTLPCIIINNNNLYFPPGMIQANKQLYINFRGTVTWYILSTRTYVQCLSAYAMFDAFNVRWRRDNSRV